MGNYTKRGAGLKFLKEVALSSNTDSCVIWPYAVGWKGYGNLIRTSLGHLRPHRYVCAKAHGLPPNKMEAAHRCGNSSCVNPRHLYWATSKDNSEDMVTHGTKAKGEKHQCAKLTEEQVKEIRSSNARGIDLAEQYGISPSHVSSLRSGLYW